MSEGRRPAWLLRPLSGRRPAWLLRPLSGRRHALAALALVATTVPTLAQDISIGLGEGTGVTSVPFRSSP